MKPSMTNHTWTEPTEGRISKVNFPGDFDRWNEFCEWRSDKVKNIEHSAEMLEVKKEMKDFAEYETRRVEKYEKEQDERLKAYRELPWYKKIFTGEPARSYFSDHLTTGYNLYRTKLYLSEMERIRCSVPELTVENYLHWVNGRLK